MRAALLALWLALPVAAQSPARSGGLAPLRSDGNGYAMLRDTVSLDLSGTTVAAALRTIAERQGLTLSFDADLPGLQWTVSVRGSGLTVAAALRAALGAAPLELYVTAGGQVVVRQRPPRLEGTVRDATRGTPVSGASVRAIGTNVGALTSADGRFVLSGLPNGPLAVLVRAVGYRPARADSLVAGSRPGELLEIVLEALPLTLASVVVTPGRFSALQEADVAAPQTLSREAIETRAQIGEDLFRAINRLPGLSSNDYSAAFRVRGGADTELHVRLDGLELHEPFHLKDLDNALSIIDVQAVGGVELATGGFGVARGGRLAGALDMVSVAPPERGARTVLGLSATNVRAMSSGSFAGGNGAWLASVRRGYLDLVLGLSGGDENLDPTYQDGFAKVRYRLGDRHVITAHALTAGDVLGYQDDESEPRVDSRYASHYGWLNWDATWGRVTTRTQASVGLLTWRRDGSHVPPGGGARDLSLLDRRRFEFAGARLDGWLDVTPAAGVSFGAERRGDAASYDYVKIERRLVVVNDSLRPRTDSVRFGRAPSGTRVAAWLAPRLRPFAALTIEPGVRYERSSSDGADWWSPRLHLALAAGARTTLRAGWGGYVQPQELYQLGVVDADTLFSLAETAEQRVLGIEYVTPRGLTLRAEAYERLLPSPRSRFSNLDGAQGAFPELSDDRVRVTPERGRVRGFELFAQREGARVSWSGSYAYSQGRDLVAGVWIPRELDQPHTLYVDFTYRLSGRWRVAWAWQYHSGWPITMAAFAVDTLSDGNVIITRSYPELRSERLPGYHRLDLRLTHEFPVRRGRLWAFVDVFNAYDRSNPRGSGYQLSYNGSRLSVRRVFETLFPRIPSFGLSWEF